MYTTCKTGLISLFVDGQPIVYEVHKSQQAFYFEPLSSWKDLIAPEGFSLERLEAAWTTSKVIDTDLFYQAVEEVEKLF